MCHISSFGQAYVLNLGSGETFLHAGEEQITLSSFLLKKKKKKKKKKEKAI